MDPQQPRDVAEMAPTTSKFVRNMAPKTRIVIPTYGTQSALDALLDELPEALLSCCIVIDDGSPVAITGPAEVTIIRHKKNRGYGAAQKTGYRHAISLGAKQILMIHGDNQYDVNHSLALLKTLKFGDIALGARPLWPHTGNYPLWRRKGNQFLTWISRCRYGIKNCDLHTGARAYRTDIFDKINFIDFSDNYIFDQQLLVCAIRNEMRIVESPMPPKYDDTVLRIAPLPAIRYALGCLKLSLF